MDICNFICNHPTFEEKNAKKIVNTQAFVCGDKWEKGGVKEQLRDV